MMEAKLSAKLRACPDTSFIDTIHVYAAPKIYLGPDWGLCLQGSPIILQNLQDANEAIHSLWNTGDTTKALKVIHPGFYSLTVRSEPLGCSATGTININMDCNINIPNAFTPDGDGENDYFFPRQLLSKNITQFKMKVYNRWGQMVYETSRIDGRGWNGRFNDQDQPQGIYIYDIEVKIKGLNTERYQGNIMLVK